MADQPLFPRDHNYKAHYMHHRSLPPRWVQSKVEMEYLRDSKLWSMTYLHQYWPQSRYHKDFSITVERAPDVEEFFNERNGQVDERARQKAITARDRQRQRAIRVVRTESDIQKLGPDWMPYADLPAEKARLAQEELDNAADTALFGGNVDPFLEEAEAEPVMVMGEPLRRGRRGVAV